MSKTSLEHLMPIKEYVDNHFIKYSKNCVKYKIYIYIYIYTQFQIYNKNKKKRKRK